MDDERLASIPLLAVLDAWEFRASLEEHPQMAILMLNAIIARLHRREHHG